jgi:hypothetical protein
MHARLEIAALLAALGACAAPLGQAPSLSPRTAETIDPRLPVGTAAAAGPVSPALAARLAALVEQARAGDAAFRDAAVRAQALVAGAGSEGSESWVAAQQAVSAAVAARGPTTRALGDIDGIAASAIAAQGGMAAGDFAAIKAALAEVGAIDRRHAETIDALQARLAG